jgi:Na+-exporting ATPase
VYYRRQSRKRLGLSWQDMDIEDRVFGEYLGSSPSNDDKQAQPIDEENQVSKARQ